MLAQKWWVGLPKWRTTVFSLLCPAFEQDFFPAKQKHNFRIVQMRGSRQKTCQVRKILTRTESDI